MERFRFSPTQDTPETKTAKALFKNGETMCATVLSTLRFYDAIPEDMRKAFELLKWFASHVDEADRFDEYHLLPIATEIFGTNSFPLHTEYIFPLRVLPPTFNLLVMKNSILTVSMLAIGTQFSKWMLP